MNSEFLEGTDNEGYMVRLTPNSDGSYSEYRTRYDFFGNPYWVKVGVWDTLSEANGEFTWHEVNLK